MSNTKDANKITEKYKINNSTDDGDDGEDILTACRTTESCSYAVTISKKNSTTNEADAAICSGQKSFISIHSTDHLCQATDVENLIDLDEFNVEVLSLNKVFPSTSEDSLSNDDESTSKKKKNLKREIQKSNLGQRSGNSYAPSNSKSSTVSERQSECAEGHGGTFSDLNIPKNTMYVIGSNPGEPKMNYQDPPKKMSKTMKKFLRNIDKHKNNPNKATEKAISKLTTVRGILKDGRCGPECTGDSTLRETEDYNTAEDMAFVMDLEPQENYYKQTVDKSVSFNTQVLIFHFTGDLCVGQSIETLSKEKDQQERNSELRKTFLTKFNEHWPTQK